MINGIEELASRSDLIDRSILLTLPRITEQQRKTEAEFWAEFEEAKGFIFGWLLDCVVAAFKNLPTTELESLPRMADFAKWVCAAETSIGWNGERFLTAYRGNRRNANETAMEASEIGKPLVEFLNDHQQFEGTATDLLNKLDEAADEASQKQRLAKNSGWPRSARGLSGKLRRLAPNLRQLGFDVEMDLPKRGIRLGRQTTVSTVATVVDDMKCDELQYGSDGQNGQMRTQSKEVLCDCGERMTLSETVANGRRDWDCPGCGRMKPVCPVLTK